MKYLFIIFFSFIAIASDQEDSYDCKKIIYDSIDKNLSNISIDPEFFNRVDNLSKHARYQFYFARIQKIGNELFYYTDVEDTESKKRLYSLLTFIKTHILEFNDFDMVVNLYDQNNSLRDLSYSKVYYSGPIFTSNYTEQEKILFKKEPMFILMPDFFVIQEDYPKKINDLSQNNILFEQKIDRAIFRGGDTAQSSLESTDIEFYRHHPRGKIFFLSYIFPDYIDAKPTNPSFFNRKDKDNLILKLFLESIYGKHFKHNFVNIEDQAKFKYILSLDGITASWSRPLIILFTDSLLLYETNFNQWFQEALIPWYNHVPIKADLSDLLTMIDWARSNQEKVKKIIANQKKTAESCFTPAEIERQFVYLLKNYSEKFDYPIIKKDNFKKFNGVEKPTYWQKFKRYLKFSAKE